MSMESHYTINVSLNGSHLFATAVHSGNTPRKAKRLLSVIRQRFPAAEGFKVTCTYWRCEGQEVKDFSPSV